MREAPGRTLFTHRCDEDLFIAIGRLRVAARIEIKFTPKDVVQPLSGILGRKVDIANFQNHLGAFSSDERGGILERFGKERAYKYRFSDPKMQPYVLMQGISAGALGNDALKILSAPEQPRLSADF